MKAQMFLAAALCLPLFGLCAQENPSNENSLKEGVFKEIDAFLEGEMKTWNIPNISLAITGKDGILYIKEYGGGKKGNYLIGSVSKPFTAIAVMQLAGQGKINLDLPVKNYLDWFETDDKSVSDKITVRDLLRQTGGLPKNAGFFSHQATSQDELEKAYADYLSSVSANEAALGKTHIYCNFNYLLLGQIVEKASGMPYAEYVSKYVFAPCGMKNTFASYRQSKENGLRQGYQYMFGYPIQTDNAYNDDRVAAGDIASNAEDMSKFLQTLLNNGKTADSILLPENVLKEMQTPFSNRYGMGFSAGPWNGLQSVRHSGLTKNYGSAINLLPEKGLGIVILANINSFYAVKNLMDGTIRRLDGQEKISYPPYEMYFRYGLAFMFLWALSQFLWRLRQWGKLGFARRYSKAPKTVFGLCLNIFTALIWLPAVVYMADMPLASLPLMQPDLGYALIGGAVVGVCSGFVRYVLKSLADAPA